MDLQENIEESKRKEMSDEVSDSNPYSRLMALKKMHVVQDYEKIREYTVMIVGIGGVGSVAAEMLTRCGIGKLILYDYDKVELANMNRLFFTPLQTGLSKVEAARETLHAINPDVDIECHNLDVTLLSSYEILRESILHGGLKKDRIQLLLCCVDNYNARTVINQICLREDQIWMETGISEDCLSGHIQMMIPGCTACFLCIPPYLIASGTSESTLKREGACAASLPTTVSLVSSLCIQNTLKYLLHFGDVSYYLSYSAMTDYFSSSVLYPNTDCVCAECRMKQQEKQGSWTPQMYQYASKQNETKQNVIHEENEWNIEVLDSGVDPDHSKEDSFPSKSASSSDVADSSQGMKVMDEELDDLMNELNDL